MKTSIPKRIQRKRSKGWKMPDNTVYVGRPTKWGNPFKVGDKHPKFMRPLDHEECYEFFKELVSKRPPEFFAHVKEDFRGKDLACWCSLDKPCHADVLLKIANEEDI